MRILALNPGSSTLKYRLLDLVDGATHCLCDGLIDHVAGDSTMQAAREVIQRCGTQGFAAVGCRIVHGGVRFREPTLVTPAVVDAIRELGKLAPLHNPIAAGILEAITKQAPELPVVAVFDTAFHHTIPEVAALYALPVSLAREKGLRRYGFHGTSHRFVSERLLACLGKQPAGTRLVTCHLGNGCSLCAVRDGKSVDTSMGMTPLEGLVMGTRSGDVDPGLLLHLLREEGYSPDQLDDLLNHKSGLLGLAGSGDVRDLTKMAQAGDPTALLALDIFSYRVRKYIGAFAAVLEGLDAIAFTAGIGEHSVLLRDKICKDLGWLGVRLDRAVNENPGRGEVRISTADSGVAVWIIPTDEESQIARETAQVVASLRERKG